MTVTEHETPDVQSDAPVEASDGLRLFFGNLDFRVSAPELKEYLAAYNVLQVTIPKRRVRAKTTNKPYNRGMGYGFAQFASTEDASKALEELTDATWNDRKLTVSLAKPNQPKSGETEAGEAGEAAEEGADGEAAPKRSKRARRSKKDVSAESGETTEAAGAVADGEAKEKPRGRRPPLPLNEDAPTTDTVFVAGIPRAATVPDVKEFFAAEEPVSVKISQQNVFNRKEKTRERVNRGFALVKFADQVTRDAVIKKYNEQEWDGRVIHLRVALEVLQTEGSEESKVEAGADAEAEAEVDAKAGTETEPAAVKTEDEEVKPVVKTEAEEPVVAADESVEPSKEE